MGLTNKIRQAFNNIQADPQLIESTKRALTAKRSKKVRKRPGLLLALACMTLSFIAGMQAYAWILTPVSYVSIDVNPSMELALNRIDRVISASPYNDEGAEILDGLQLRWKKYTDAIKTIMESNTMGTYLVDDPELLFTVASDKDRELLLETGVTDASRETGHDCHSVSTDIETAAQAHDSGLSLGKYNAYLLLLQYDAAITIDQCKDMSISEMHALIQRSQQEESLPPEEESPQEDLFEEDLFEEDLLQEDLFEEDLFQEDLFKEDPFQEDPPQEEVPPVTDGGSIDDVYNIPAHDQNEQRHHGGHH